MKLSYYKEELNFGDALNKLIFEHYIPELLDDNEETLLLGLGTVLGLEKGDEKTKKIIVFSSGYGFGDEKTYGTLPALSSKYEIICVRGPLTAEKLNIDKSLAISDGAILLHGMAFPKQDKQYDWAYIPHHISDKQYNWERIAKKAGGHYISASNEPDFVISEIQKCKFVVTEAMHGAIVADTLRVPWIPAKAYEHINEFKWNDWLSTVNLSFSTNKIPSLFSPAKIEEMIGLKLFQGKKNILVKSLGLIYRIYQRFVVEPKAVKELKDVSLKEQNLSEASVLQNKYEQLKGKIDLLKSKYKK